MGCGVLHKYRPKGISSLGVKQKNELRPNPQVPAEANYKPSQNVKARRSRKKLDL